MESLAAIDSEPWKEAIAVVKNNLRLPEEKRAKNRTEIYNYYRFNYLQIIVLTTINPKYPAKVPKESMQLIGNYLSK